MLGFKFRIHGMWRVTSKRIYVRKIHHNFVHNYIYRGLKRHKYPLDLLERWHVTDRIWFERNPTWFYWIFTTERSIYVSRHRRRRPSTHWRCCVCTLPLMESKQKHACNSRGSTLAWNDYAVSGVKQAGNQLGWPRSIHSRQASARTPRSIRSSRKGRSKQTPC